MPSSSLGSCLNRPVYNERHLEIASDFGDVTMGNAPGSNVCPGVTTTNDSQVCFGLAPDPWRPPLASPNGDISSPVVSALSAAAAATMPNVTKQIKN